MYDLIKKWEGCRLTAYICPAGKVTIGWGSTCYENGAPIRLGDKITQDKADYLLDWYCKTQIKLPAGVFSCRQQEALYSLIYNIGQHAFDISKCKLAIEKKDWKRAYKEWDWSRAGGKVLPGLVNRRKEEKNMFFEDISCEVEL